MGTYLNGIPINPVGGCWLDWADNSTVLGWSYFTDKYLYYMDLGGVCLVQFKFSGASNSTTTSFTLPFVGEDFPGGYQNFDCISRNNGSYQLSGGLVRIASETTLVEAHKNKGYGGWTGVGTKTIEGQFIYRKRTSDG